MIEARGKLVIPGFVNAHYHSYDVLAKGLLEDMPFDVWALHSQPAYFGRRSKAEIRARTLLGALECLRNGITTLQDMNSLVPQDEETLDTSSAPTRRSASASSSPSRCATSRRSTSPRSCPPDVPEAAMAIIRGAPKDAREEIAFVERQIQRLDPAASAPELGLEPFRAAALIARTARGRRRPRAALRAADIHPRLRDQGADGEGAGDLRRRMAAR